MASDRYERQVWWDNSYPLSKSTARVILAGGAWRLELTRDIGDSTITLRHRVSKDVAVALADAIHEAVAKLEARDAP